jgi:hypothetical protein
MDEISARRVESLALHDCEEKERNAMVARIESITITTMSSTRVNHFCRPSPSLGEEIKVILFAVFINVKLKN